MQIPYQEQINNIKVWNWPDLTEIIRNGIHKHLLKENADPQLQFQNSKKFEFSVADLIFQKKPVIQFFMWNFPIFKTVEQGKLRLDLAMKVPSKSENWFYSVQIKNKSILLSFIILPILMLRFSSCIFLQLEWFHLFNKFELLLSAKHYAKYWGSTD